MCHHRHFMQRRLTVEQHWVIIHQVTFHFPTVLQCDITRSLVISQINTITSVTNHIFSTRVLVWSITNILRQAVDVVRCNNFRIRQGPGNRERHTHLIKIKIGVTRNDSTSRKVHTLTHQISSQSTFLTLQSCSDRLDRTPSLLKSLRLACNIIVHVSCNVKLQQCFKFTDNVLRRTIHFETLNVNVGLDDVGQLKRQVILTSSSIVESNRGSNWWGWHRQHSDQHPLGPRVVFVETQFLAVLGTDVSQDAQNL